MVRNGWVRLSKHDETIIWTVFLFSAAKNGDSAGPLALPIRSSRRVFFSHPPCDCWEKWDPEWTCKSYWKLFLFFKLPCFILSEVTSLQFQKIWQSPPNWQNIAVPWYSPINITGVGFETILPKNSMRHQEHSDCSACSIWWHFGGECSPSPQLSAISPYLRYHETHLKTMRLKDNLKIMPFAHVHRNILF